MSEVTNKRGKSTGKMSRGPGIYKAFKGPQSRRTRSERSLASRFLSILKSGGDARATKIKRVRQSVKQQAYENDLKLSIAVERMARELV